MNPTEALILSTLYQFLNIYLMLIFARVLLSWFYTEGWAQQAISFLGPVTDPYLNIFRSFIPPLGGMDFSCMVAGFALYFVGDFLLGMLATAFSAI